MGAKVCFYIVHSYFVVSLPFAAVFIYVGVRTYLIYKGKRLKRLYLMFAAVFRLICMFALSFVFGTFAAAYLIRFGYLDYF